MTSHDEHSVTGDRLACGRPVDELLDQVAAGRADRRDDHQQGCVHCQAALGEYRRLWSPVHELAAQPVAAPRGRIDRILRQIRGVLAEPDHAVLAGPDGVTRIAARVIVVTARRSAQSVPGVRVALSRTLGAGGAERAGGAGGTDGDVVAGVAGASTAIEIVLAADYGQDLHALADRVRRTVAERVSRLTGLSTTELTVVIDDVLE
ncbi:Asp23/Gls24 family envelope stress response protein [Pseudonocardia sp. NPDC049635]|uniref:Asp23/Gls24 family envelope stress response protein n=1 Tax=Pseudonocardia sp. NPDC049635 TaxID=3155506 RepID=UPI0033F9C281